MQALKRRRTDAYVTDTPIILTKPLDERDVDASEIVLEDLPLDDAIDYAAELEILDSESEQEDPDEREPDLVDPEPLDLAALWAYHFDYHAIGN